jgi:hypothetical protein
MYIIKSRTTKKKRKIATKEKFQILPEYKSMKIKDIPVETDIFRCDRKFGQSFCIPFVENFRVILTVRTHSRHARPQESNGES